jgi:predicted Zn-dependent protease
MLERKLTVILAVVMFLLCSSIGVAADESPVLGAMQEEMLRSMDKLELEGFETPYFIAYSLNELYHTAMSATYGALENFSESHTRYISVDLHVGDYQFDNTPSGAEFFYMPDYYDRFSSRLMRAPVDDDFDALRHRLWLLTDGRFKQALNVLNKKKGELISKVEEEDRPDDFSQETPSVRIDPLKTLELDTDKWNKGIQTVSAMFKRYPEILTSSISLAASLRNQFMVNTEGSKLQLSDYYFTISVTANARCDDGMNVYNIHTWKASTLADLPTFSEIQSETQKLIDDLLALRGADPTDPYSGPAIIVNEAAGVFFHEALGHRLEGHRLRNEREGHTFKGKVGQKIIPEFLSVFDDPTLKEYDGTPLYGHYEYDQEMVKAQRVELVEDGVLKGFLMSRLPAKEFPKSNGHGRADMYSKPVSRMGNLIVTTNDAKSYDELIDMLVEECVAQEKEYGLIFEVLSAGETNTSGYGVQSLKCRPVMVRKIYVEDRRTELVRGVELIGTPLNMLENVIAAGDDPAVFNGACGAESGSIPVSSVAPSILISKLEVQKSTQKSRRPPILPPPLFD